MDSRRTPDHCDGPSSSRFVYPVRSLECGLGAAVSRWYINREAGRKLELSLDQPFVGTKSSAGDDGDLTTGDHRHDHRLPR